MKFRFIFLSICLALAVRAADATDLLKRRAVLGFSLADFPAEGGAVVGWVDPASPAGRAGLAKGDLVLTLNGSALRGQIATDSRVAALRGGETLTLSIRKGDAAQTLRFELAALPKDAEPGVEFAYEQVPNPRSGLRQRVILSRPAASTGRLPAVFFIPWLSCDSVETPRPARGGIENLLYRVAAESGQVLVRIEKPGVGDSEGVCSETDFLTELAGAKAAVEAFREHPWVDGERVVLMGHSFSGSFLPAVLEPRRVRGYLFINSFVTTWLERLLLFERKQLEAAGLPAGEVWQRIRKLTRLYVAVLEDGLTPAQAATRAPDLAGAWQDEPEHQYGRPVRFMRQLQATNVAELWEAVDRPTLAVYGEADIVMHLADHERLVAIVNRNRPGAARLTTVPAMDHGLSIAGPQPQTGPPESLVTAVLEWLAEVNR